MGLHQAITDKNLSHPCDCGEDDDHSVNLNRNWVALEDAIPPEGDEWTDSTESTE